MIVRKIRPEDYKRVKELEAHAFEYGFEDDKTAQEMLERAAAEPRQRQDQNWQSRWAAFEEDDKTMLGTFIAIPYRAHFDGHEVSMAGIGGVATLPQYRRRGSIRKCFEAALPDLYEGGVALSYLYPFSTAFYRKFGYELGCRKDRYKLKLANLPGPRTEGACQLLEPGVDLKAQIRHIDAQWQRRYNLMVLDEEIEYRWVDRANPFRDVVYTYVYQDAEGKPKGYMTYRPVLDEGDRALECDRFFFLDTEGFYGLLALLKAQEADHTHVILRLPEDVDLGGILPEWSMGTIGWRREQAGMVRVIHVEQVLRMARMRGDGRLVLEIADGQIEQNNGRFAVEFAEGASNAVYACEEEPDIVLPIQEFSRLICGRCDVADLRWLPQVKLFCEPEKAAKVFYKKPMYITRYF